MVQVWDRVSVQALRGVTGWSIADLARQLGLGRTAVEQWHKPVPSLPGPHARKLLDVALARLTDDQKSAFSSMMQGAGRAASP